MQNYPKFFNNMIFTVHVDQAKPIGCTCPQARLLQGRTR